ncbi:MAG TPA: DivIVA domain-containing protein [Candidatus Limiplasma sp.]|nr:DivIVA domain-containing protein [Candidatus Limiplasma sp.]HPS81094.1 DivIVA domain-containing protein [Candidatus Limiplasma sp.]
MAITVSDIEQKEFTYKGAGYDPYDVDQYLDQICDELVAMQDRIDQLEADLAKARQEAEVAANAVKPVQPEVVRTVVEAAPVAQTSQTLENILLSAQKLADGAVEDAKRKADAIVKEAQDKATSLMDDAKEEKATLEKGLETLHTAANEFKKNFLTLLDGQKDLLESNVSLFTDTKKG